jgi:voltage-gated potassium channel Kch
MVMDNQKFWTWINLKNEIIFFIAMCLAYLSLLSISFTEEWALILTLAVMILTTAYFSITFFDSPSIGKLYLYLCILLFLIGFFALIYKSFGVYPPGAVEPEQLNWLDAIYFSVVTWTTLGYGDFRPSDETKIWVMIETLLGYVYMGLFVGKIIVLGQKQISSKSKVL